jgi:hypothetical protein
VQFDGRARVLRVDLSKEVAERYPEFDRDRFEAMDEQGVREYESRLFEFFPGHGVADAGRRRHSPPEWLMTGVWITVPPDRAEHLSDEARTFANEFSPMAGTSADSAARPLRTSVDERTFASARGREGFERVEEERIVALEDPLSDTDETTPPHGDKLR